MKTEKTEEAVETAAEEEETEKYEDSLTYKVLRQDLEFERTGENRITRPYMTRARAKRVLRTLKKKVIILTVVKGRKVIWKGYVNKEGFRVMADALALRNGLDVTYNALGEVRIALSKLNESWEEHTAG